MLNIDPIWACYSDLILLLNFQGQACVLSQKNQSPSQDIYNCCSVKCIFAYQIMKLEESKSEDSGKNFPPHRERLCATGEKKTNIIDGWRESFLSSSP